MAAPDSKFHFLEGLIFYSHLLTPFGRLEELCRLNETNTPKAFRPLWKEFRKRKSYSESLTEKRRLLQAGKLSGKQVQDLIAEFSYLQKYFGNVDSATKPEKKLDDLLTFAQVDSYEQGPFGEQGSREHLEEFQRLMRYALITLVYSYVEVGLKWLCERQAQKIGPNALRYKDIWMKGFGLSQAKLYMTKYLALDWPEDSQELRDVKILGTLRNMIVHNDGMLGPKRTPAKEFNKHVRKNVDEQSQVYISRKYIFEAIDASSEFLRLLIDRNRKKLSYW